MRESLDRLLTVAAGTAALLACGLFLAIGGFVLSRGLPALSWDFLTAATSRAGAAGGILYQLAGTTILIATALVAAVPLAVAVALGTTVYAAPGWRRRLRRFLLTANGTPSILFGIFGLVLFGELLGWGKSWLAGGLVLGLMVLPTLAVSVMERIEAIPGHYVEAAFGLGLSRSQVVRSVILPQSLDGLVSGALLGLARAAGETAPILFTAAVFSGATLPSGIRESPVLALPYHIFVLAQDSLDPAAQTRLWAAAAVLLALVLTLSLAALAARLRIHEEARHG